MSRPLVLISLTAFAMMLGLGVLFPVLPFYVRWLSLTEVEAGILMASYAAMSVLTSPLWGRFSERVGRKPAIVIGLTGFGVGFTLFGLGTTLPELLGARILGGLFAAATLPAIFSYVADVSEPDERVTAMGTVGAAIGLGILTGPILGGLLAPLGLRVPFFVSGAIGFSGALAVVLFLPESLTADDRRRAAEVRATLEHAPTTRRVARAILPFLSFILIVQTARMSLESTVGFLMQDRFAAGPGGVGALLGTLGLVAVAVQGGAVRPLSRRFRDFTLLLAGIALTGLGLAGLAWASTRALLYAWGALLALGYALLTPAFNALLSRAAEGVQGEAQGLKNGTESLGRVIGPVVFTSLYFYAGGTVAYTSAAVLCAVAGIVAWHGLRERE